LVDRRLSELGVTASVKHELAHEIKTDDPSGVEAYWHRRFQAQRMRGEWFKLSAADVRAFKRWRRIY
jgi:Meiotically up-regulated gene 113